MFIDCFGWAAGDVGTRGHPFLFVPNSNPIRILAAVIDNYFSSFSCQRSDRASGQKTAQHPATAVEIKINFYYASQFKLWIYLLIRFISDGWTGLYFISRVSLLVPIIRLYILYLFYYNVLSFPIEMLQVFCHFIFIVCFNYSVRILIAL